MERQVKKLIAPILSLALLLAPAMPALAADAAVEAAPTAVSAAQATPAAPAASADAAATLSGTAETAAAAPVSATAATAGQATPVSAAAQAVATPVAASPTAAADPNVPEAVDASQPPPPMLPSGLTATATAQEPESVTETAEPGLPTEVLAKPGEAKPDEPHVRYKFSNFALGFLGGALLGSAAGVLFNSSGEGSSMGANAAIYGGIGGLVFGTAGLFLGATTPEEAKPPKVDEGAARPGWPGVQVALRF